ncbi:ubiquitin-conjugating enzyme E2-22 kDa-like [Rhopilema esculentum]|uniref:ubiquitin-conjugating enzyme E2-22 kDa-like n=1 Tax=Rhopilema esculentum TaxID=499914 RepID=UPI0031E05997|eukprot:gene443-10115_t
MSNIAVARIQREFREVIRSEEAQKNNIKLELVDDTYTKLRGEISGPPDTPYEGGRFVVDIDIPETYPFNPPKVKFATRIWHPNVSSVTGAICLDILKDQWAAAMTLRTVLISIQALLASPEPSDPQDEVVARQYRENMQAFTTTAKHWAQVYGGVQSKDIVCEKKIKQLVDMGFDVEQSRTALSMHSWNVERAIESLFNQ